MENFYELGVPELCTMEMKEIDGGDALFWVGLALSCVPGATLAGQLIAVSSYGASNDLGTSKHNYGRLY